MSESEKWERPETEVERELGREHVERQMQYLGRKRRGYPGHVEETERNEDIWRLKAEGGLSYRELMDRYGLSRTRLQEIVRREEGRRGQA